MDLFQALSKGVKFTHCSKPTKQSITATELPPTAVVPELDFFNAPSCPTTASQPPHTNELSETLPFPNDDAVTKFRSSNNIKVTPVTPETPVPIQSFAELRTSHQFSPHLINQLSLNHYHTPTPIQMQASSIILNGQDLVACAPTGSGKTLAYLLPFVHLLTCTPRPTCAGPRLCVIAPTRELALQIHRHLLKLKSASVQFNSLVLVKTASKSFRVDPAVAYDIVIATPLSLIKHTVPLTSVRFLVLDEADRLLEHGFIKQVDGILAKCPSVRQTVMFSATLSSTVETLAKSVLSENMVRLIIGVKNTGNCTIDQSLVFVGNETGKLMTIRQHLKEGSLKPPVLIFVQSIDRAKQLYKELDFEGVDVIHKDRSESQRDSVIQKFRLGHTWILICTDCLARGIDLVVNTVVNYDFPQTTESYIHRIGRAGRAGRPGTAITYFSKLDASYLRSIVNVVVQSGGQVPEWMLNLNKPPQAVKRALKLAPVHRPQIGPKERTRFVVPNNRVPGSPNVASKNARPGLVLHKHKRNVAAHRPNARPKGSFLSAAKSIRKVSKNKPPPVSCTPKQLLSKSLADHMDGD